MNIAFVGLSGSLKRNRACDVRLAMFANVMSEDNDVIVINRYSSLYDLTDINIAVNNKVSMHELIEPQKTGRLTSALLLVFSVIVEPFYIIRQNRINHIDVLHIYSGHYFDFLLYRLVSKIIKAKTVYQYVEYRSSLENKNPYHKVNSYLCDKKGAKLWDGVIAISTFLEQKALEVNNKIVSVRIPPLCDFSLYESVHGHANIGVPYILYCGSIGYLEVVDLILKAYRNSKIKNDVKLVLVLGGSEKEVKDFSEKNNDVIVKHNLSYSDLILHYKGAEALLIPLRNNIRDIARFPNKICEYLAARCVVVTTAVGEMKEFFVDGESAIVALDYSVEALKDVFDKYSIGYYDLPQIRQISYKIGLDYFDTKSVKDRITSFLEKITI